MTLRQALFQALEGLRDRSVGALVRRLPDGSQAGAIFTAEGRISWATCAGPGELVDLPQGEAVHAVPRERLEEALRRPRLEVLRETCEAIRALVAHDGSWEWVRHDGLAYSASLTFGPADVSSGLSVLEDPTLVEIARRRLADVMLPSQYGLTLEGDENMPLAHIGCGALLLGTLLDVATQARELMALGRTALATGLIAVLDGSTSAIWREDRLLHVVIHPDGNAVGRLVSQLAEATATQAVAP